MTISEFCVAVATIGKRYQGSVTSWGRSVKHSTDVGGFNGDPHTWWLGVDMIYDSPPTPQLDVDAKTLGLKVLHEKGHDHFQPLGWINRPQ